MIFFPQQTLKLQRLSSTAVAVRHCPQNTSEHRATFRNPDLYKLSMLLPRSFWVCVRDITRPLCSPRSALHLPKRPLLRTLPSRNLSVVSLRASEGNDHESSLETDQDKPEHAVISTFDLFSIGGQCRSVSCCLFLLLRTAPLLPLTTAQLVRAARIQLGQCVREKYSSTTY